MFDIMMYFISFDAIHVSDNGLLLLGFDFDTLSLCEVLSATEVRSHPDLGLYWGLVLSLNCDSVWWHGWMT